MRRRYCWVWNAGRLVTGRWDPVGASCQPREESVPGRADRGSRLELAGSRGRQTVAGLATGRPWFQLEHTSLSRTGKPAPVEGEKSALKKSPRGFSNSRPTQKIWFPVRNFRNRQGQRVFYWRLGNADVVWTVGRSHGNPCTHPVCFVWGLPLLIKTVT